MIEAERRAYADRAEHLGDADFYPVPIKELISKEYATKRFANLMQSGPASVPISVRAIPAESLETTHASVMTKTVTRWLTHHPQSFLWRQNGGRGGVSAE